MVSSDNQSTIFNRICEWLVDWFLFRKIAHIFGGNLRFILVDQGFLAEEIKEFIQVCFCCPVIRVLSMPETCGPIAISPMNIAGDSWHEEGSTNLNRIRNSSLYCSDSESLGRAIPCCRLKVIPVMHLDIEPNDTTEIGELCVQGPNVFSGYWKNKQLTIERKSDNWYRTGLICEFDNESLIYRGHIHSFVTVPQTNIANIHEGEHNITKNVIGLEYLEWLYTSSVSWIRQMWLHPSWHTRRKGNKINKMHNFNSNAIGLYAICHVDHEKCFLWSKQNNIGLYHIDRLCEHPALKQTVIKELQSVRLEQNLPRYSEVLIVKLVPEPYTVHTQLLTTTFALRRDNLEKRYPDVTQTTIW